MTNRDNLHAKVRAILEKANHPNTPQAEAETALTLAFRLMQKYGIDESSINKRTFDNETVTSKTFTITGQYRVRRGTLLWNIANAVSCHSYRDMMEPNPTQVIMVAFGTENDLFSLEALYTAADLLAARSIPAGDRRFKTSWWRGYCEAIGAKLAKEHQTIAKESPGVGLVLVERADEPVAPGVHVAVGVDVIAVGIGVAGEVEPMHGLLFAVVRVGEEAVDDLLIGLRRLVGEEG
ncbi:MAG: hypothetical protein RL200_539, partial [Actinomycetota bacterium]